MLSQRSSGILIHISSLPSQFGIGDLGFSSYRFIDFMEKSGQKFWQILPTVPADTIYGGSPYMGFSAIAGNPILISPEMLVAEHFLGAEELAEAPVFSEYQVDFEQVSVFKKGLLQTAFRQFKEGSFLDAFADFCASESSWLADYSLFMALKELYANVSWHEWPHPLASRQEKALAEAQERCAERVEYYKFEQFCFSTQWKKMREYASEKQISIIGDLPIYVSFDSADVWANQDCFRLDSTNLTPTHVAGVPPDYFSETGQRWGNPLYKWNLNKKKNSRLYNWWHERFKQMAKMVDVVRIDHFRGFESYWEIPAVEETAVNGVWRRGPGRQFFNEMALDSLNLPIIAEDLGVITPEVERLRDDLGFPGMKILQFAFDSDTTNSYLPHNYTTPRCVVYTGTHDNNTTVGWFLGDDSSAQSNKMAQRYCNSQDDAQIHWCFLKMAFSSVAGLAIIPMQDILGFGEDCRMNTPGTSCGNWGWRCAPRFFTDEVAFRLKDETIFYNRIIKKKTL